MILTCNYFSVFCNEYDFFYNLLKKKVAYPNFYYLCDYSNSFDLKHKIL